MFRLQNGTLLVEKIYGLLFLWFRVLDGRQLKSRTGLVTKTARSAQTIQKSI
jgi:hypothetical protein